MWYGSRIFGVMKRAGVVRNEGDQTKERQRWPMGAMLLVGPMASRDNPRSVESWENGRFAAKPKGGKEEGRGRWFASFVRGLA